MQHEQGVLVVFVRHHVIHEKSDDVETLLYDVV